MHDDGPHGVNSNMLLSLKKSKKQRKNTEQKENSKAMHIQRPSNRYSAEGSEKKDATPTEATTEKRTKQEQAKAHSFNRHKRATKTKQHRYMQ